jgi:hypothetical protein
MSATFSIHVEPQRDLVRIRMSGFFTQADIEDFLEARRKAHQQLRCAPNAHLTINDLSGMKIQAQDIVANFQAMLASPDYRSRRLAFVTGSTLARGQLLRAATGRYVRCFDDVATAEAWLFEENQAGKGQPRRCATG